MDIRIYQIDSQRDNDRVKFLSLKHMLKALNSDTVDASLYCKTYSGTVERKSLEDVYTMFNLAHPANFRSHSLSVSDVVEIVSSNSIEPGFYYCDSFGFAKIEFDASLTTEFQVAA